MFNAEEIAEIVVALEIREESLEDKVKSAAPSQRKPIMDDLMQCRSALRKVRGKYL